METVMKADIFFVISTVAVVLVALALIVALVYIILFLRNALYVSRRVKEESDELIKDIEALRTTVKIEGFKVRHAIGFLKNIFGKSRRRKSSKESEKE